MIQLDNLTKVFETPNGPIVAADRITMEVPEGEICILLGPSGCGKTTTLKMVNRLIPPSFGKVFINGKDTSSYDTIELRRNIGYVIQQIGLFPNMTVEENICVVPDLLGWPKKKSRARAAEVLEMMALDPAVFLKRYSRELSGGQAQRVGVARSLAADPPVMLMDEPFGAIDPINREVIQDEFLRMNRKLGKTILFVSHDIDEAVKMGDRIAIFRAGKLEQVDTPDTVLAHPANDFIADFVGADRTLKRLRLVKVQQAQMPTGNTVTVEDRLDKAVGLMKEMGHRYITVINDDRRPIGQVELEHISNRSGLVGEHLAPSLPVLVHMDDDLRTAVSTMFAYDVTWLTVVDGSGRFQGYVTQRGITHMLGETYRKRRAQAA